MPPDGTYFRKRSSYTVYNCCSAAQLFELLDYPLLPCQLQEFENRYSYADRGRRTKEEGKRKERQGIDMKNKKEAREKWVGECEIIINIASYS